MRSSFIVRPVVAVVAVVAVIAGCTVDDPMLDLEDPTAEIVENLLAAGYPDAEIEVLDDGTVIVGGDAVVTLQASREMAGDTGTDDADFRHYRTNNLISATIDTICVDGSAFNNTGTLSTALDQAIANYNRQILRFQLVRTNGSNVGCDAEIIAMTQAGTSGLAGFPAGGLPHGQFYIGTAIAPTYGLAVTRHVIMHELGHCIGYRHTDYFDRSISCGGTPTNEGPAGVGAVHIPGTPTGAVYNGSVMNSCYNAGVSGQWAVNDVTALHELYGEGWCDGTGQIGVGDFNGDGKDDHYCHYGDGTNQFIFSEGTGVFSGRVSSLTGWCANGQFGAGDFNGDGKDDVYCHYGNGSNFVTFSQGNGTFAGGMNWTTGWCNGGQFGVGDFNGDGKDDHYCHYADGNNFVIFSQGNGAFAGGVNWTTGWCNGGQFGVGDFNGDGKDDHYCHYGDGNNFVIFSQGNGSFAGGVNWTTGWCAGGQFGVGDFNGDGKDDHYCHYGNGSNFVIFAQGNGMFSGGSNWSAGWCASGVFEAGDFSGEGRDDHYCHYGNGDNFVIFSQNNGTFSGSRQWSNDS